MTALELAKFIDEDADMGADEYFKAADMLRRQNAEIQQWRNVFGFLGTPDELGNEWNALKEVNSRQHEAIKQLREALDEINKHADGVDDQWCGAIAEQALKDTEGL